MTKWTDVPPQPKRLKPGWTFKVLPDRVYTMKTVDDSKTTLQVFKNKLNGLEYFKIPKRVKHIDGVKFALCLQTNGGQVWVRDDVLEFHKLLQV